MKKKSCGIWVMMGIAFMLTGCGAPKTDADIMEYSETVSENTQNPVPLVSYEENADGTWSAEGKTYQYKIRLEGKMKNAEKYSYFLVLTNRSDLAFEEVSKSLFSSQITDLLNPEETILLEIGTIEDREAGRPMVMVDNFLYLDTGRESTMEGRCGNMDGEIISSVAGSEVPAENNQSNFGGIGYGYQYGASDTIEISMDDKWYVFEKGAVRFRDRCFDLEDLSEETIEWISWYYGLSEEEQEKAEEIPAELME